MIHVEEDVQARLDLAATRWAREQEAWWGDGAIALAAGVTALPRIPGLPEALAAEGSIGFAGLAASTDPVSGKSALALALEGCPAASRVLSELVPFERTCAEIRGSMAIGLVIALKDALAFESV